MALQNRAGHIAMPSPVSLLGDHTTPYTQRTASGELTPKEMAAPQPQFRKTNPGPQAPVAGSLKSHRSMYTRMYTRIRPQTALAGTLRHIRKLAAGLSRSRQTKRQPG